MGAIEDPQHEEVRKAFDVGESGGELRQDFESAFGVVLGAGAFGDLPCFLIGAFDVADGLWGEHCFSHPFLILTFDFLIVARCEP